MKRPKINLSDTPLDLVRKMSEGNPGALRVLIDLMEQDELMTILSLDDMNIRGSQIWVGYKYHCNSDLDAFVKAVKTRDANMVETVNRESGSKELAVTRGASFERGSVRSMGF